MRSSRRPTRYATCPRLSLVVSVRSRLMAIRGKLTAALELSGPMCDDCLSSSTAVKPRQTVNRYCRDLAILGKLTRQNQQCPKCKAWKIVNVMDEGNRPHIPRSLEGRVTWPNRGIGRAISRTPLSNISGKRAGRSRGVPTRHLGRRARTSRRSGVQENSGSQ